MIVRRKTEVIIEQVTSTTRELRTLSRAKCRFCGREVEMAAPEEAAMVEGVSPREIYRAIEDGRLHFLENANGALLVCLGSVRELLGPT